MRVSVRRPVNSVVTTAHSDVWWAKVAGLRRRAPHGHAGELHPGAADAAGRADHQDGVTGYQIQRVDRHGLTDKTGG